MNWPTAVSIILVIGLAIAIPIVIAHAHSGTSQRGPAAAPKPPPGPAPLRTLSAGSDVGAVAFSPSGSTLATADVGGAVQLWDAANGSMLPALAAPKPSQPGDKTAYVVGAAFSRSGTMLAAGLSDGTITVWNLTTRQITATIVVPSKTQQDRGNSLYGIAFSPDGTTIASGSNGGSTSLWNAATGQQTAVLTDPGQPADPAVNAVAFSPNGSTLATADQNGHIYLWDVAARRVTATIDQDAKAVAFSPDGTTLATEDELFEIDLWNAATGNRARILQDNGLQGDLGGIPIPADVTAIAFSPSGTTLAASDNGGRTYLWDVSTGKRTATFTDRSTKGAYSAAFSPDGQLLATADANGSVYLWGTHAGPVLVPGAAPLQTLNADPVSATPVNAVAFSPSGSTLATGTTPDDVRLWNTASGHQLPALATPDPIQDDFAEIKQLTFSRDGTMLAGIDGDGAVWVWNLATRQVRKIAPPSAAGVPDTIAISRDGATVAAASLGSRRTSLWDVPTGEITAILTTSDAGDAGVDALAFSPNGSTLAIADGNGHTTLWDVAARRVTATIDTDAIVIMFSPNGATLATSDGMQVELWSAVNGARGQILKEPDQGGLKDGHPAINAMAFSPSGTALAAADQGGHTYVWEVATGKNTATLADPTGQGATSVAFSPDGHLLASGDGHGYVYLWPATGS